MKPLNKDLGIKNETPKTALDLLRLCLKIGIPIATAMLATGAFSPETKSVIRNRANGVSELSRDMVAGLPHHCSHLDHDKRNPDYDDPYNGVYATIWEHLQMHIDSERRGLVAGSSKLDNGMKPEDNKASVELLRIGTQVFEAILFEQPEKIDELRQDYVQGRIFDSVISPERAIRAIEEERSFFLNRYRNLHDKDRRDLQRKLRAHLRSATRPIPARQMPLFTKLERSSIR
jgi:hypothetical protein